MRRALGTALLLENVPGTELEATVTTKYEDDPATITSCRQRLSTRAIHKVREPSG